LIGGRYEGLKYPESQRSDHVDIIHGVRVPDPYRWLEEIDSERTREWIDAQNRITFGYLGRTQAREKIRRRIRELWDYERYTAPFKRGERYFYTKNDGLQNQNVLYWMDSLGTEPRVLLDPSRLSEDGTVALTGFHASEVGGLLAYGLSESGSDWQEWRVMEVETGRDLGDHLKWTKLTSVAWTHDGTGFYYSRYDEPEEGLEYKGPNYYQKLFHHRLGEPQPEDELVYERPDQKEWRFRPQITEDGRYLVITVTRGTYPENGVFIKDLEYNKETVELLNRFDARYIFVGNEGPLFYFMTDNGAPMARLIAIDTSRPEPGQWEQIIPEASDAIQSVVVAGDSFVLTYLHDAHNLLKVFDGEGNLIQEVRLPGMGAVSELTGRRGDPEAFYQFTEFTTPGTIYRYDVETGESEVFREPSLGFDPDDYVTEQVFYGSKDGTRVPMFISRRRDLKKDGENPCYLYGYGGFNISLTPSFNVRDLVWMEMGGVFAQANLRGGGEYGKPWHESGIKLRKQNVFDDFIAAAEWLIENGYTSTPRLAVSGRSNGGLLIGACMTQRPGLFGACVPIVGVLDMLRFEKFTVGWGWTSDYGSADDPEEFKALLAYSPYHNVRPGTDYPPTLVTTGDHDDRVFPAHSFKFAAALQATQAGDAPILIRIDTKSGHGAGKPTSKLIDEYADELAFIHKNLRM